MSRPKSGSNSGNGPLGCIACLHVVFGEMIPKALALNHIAFGLMRMLGIPDPGKTASLEDIGGVLQDHPGHAGAGEDRHTGLTRMTLQGDAGFCCRKCFSIGSPG